MKITSIKVRNFLGARHLDISLKKPVALFSGRNGAGKSSLRDAVAFALTADLCRIGLKKEASALINDGGAAACVEVCTTGNTFSVAISGAGKITDSASGQATPCALPCVLDAQRFARMNDKERRSFLFDAMGVKTDCDGIVQRLLARNCDAAKIDLISPFLVAGLDAAQKEAAARARDAKAGWKTITGGDTWGKDKSAKWQPAPPPPEADRATALRDNATARAREIEQDLSAVQQELGAAKERNKAIQQAAATREEVAEQAGRYARIADKLDRDRAEAKEWEQKVTDCRARATAGKKAGLIHDLALALTDTLGMLMPFGEMDGHQRSRLANANAVIDTYVQAHGKPGESSDADADPEAGSRLPEYEKALALLQRAVTNGERDLAAADAAARKLKELEDAAGAAPVDIEPLQAKIADLTEKRDGWRADADKYRAIADQAASRKTVIAKAAALHADVIAWTDIADALSPDGIPGEMLSDALGPINRRLRVSADATEWGVTAISPDMLITYDARSYSLLSESEKWKADAMIAEAISFITDIKLIVLDRFDVLDTVGREDLLWWLDGLASVGGIETALIFGTLKNPPAAIPEQTDSFWIDAGTIAEDHMKAAA